MALLVVVLGGAVLLASVGWSRQPGSSSASPDGPTDRPLDGPVAIETSGLERARPSHYVLVQMNLCLSGMSGCWDEVDYPAGLRDAVAAIRRVRPDAVTVNEACRADARALARRTGYHLRFARVVYDERPLPCVDPGGRGLFGSAVLTRAPVRAFETRVFESQFGPEERRWLCATTRDGDVCTAHLEIRSGAYARANDGQCEELAALLARRARDRAVVFGGDANRGKACAPEGFWTRSDRDGDQAPGVQHVYGSRDDLRDPQVRVVRAPHSDHGVLVVRARPVGD